MKNNTKIRLHLSKKLFESLTKEIIKEAKVNDGYSVAVKAPKKIKEVNAVADTDKMKKMEEMEMNVAEEGKLNELDPGTSWEAIAAGMAAIGLAPLAIDKLHQWWKKKHPESFKKAQSLSGAIDRQMGGNTPGQGHGVDTKKTFGPQNEKDTLKEYEHHYKMVNGQCRRYNDEGEYTVVSAHHCR
jgi:hypothetical protein